MAVVESAVFEVPIFEMELWGAAIRGRAAEWLASVAPQAREERGRERVFAARVPALAEETESEALRGRELEREREWVAV